jgi:hypothetical protein
MRLPTLDLPRFLEYPRSRHTLLLRGALDSRHPLGPVRRIQLGVDLVVVEDAGVVERSGLFSH